MSDLEAQGTQDTEQAKGLDSIIDKALEGFDGEQKPDTAIEAEPVNDEPGRARDAATGKFVAKSKAETEASDKGQAEVTEKSVTPQEGDTAATQQVALPDAWSPEWKAKVATLAPEHQQLVVDQYKAMQGDYTRKSQDLAEQKKQFDPVLSVVNKWSPYFQQTGMTPDRALDYLAQAEYTLRTGTPEQKQAVFAQLARDYGLSQTGQPQIAQTPYDPIVAQLSQQVTGLREYIETSEQQKLKSEIDTFSQAKDQSGQLLRPHFERVRETMGRLIDSGQAENLETAYAKAVRLDDELYKQNVESERKRVSDEAEKARLEAVEKAKKAQPVRSSDGGPKGTVQRKGLDAHLDAALEGMSLGN